MDHPAFLAFLKVHNACADAYAWAAAQPDAESCWTTNECSDWMLWLLLKTPKTPERDRLLRLAACDFAEAVLPHFENKYPDDARARQAIEAARRYASGAATNEERIKARSAAAYAAADAAAAAAAYAADAASAAAYADADAAAAYAAAYADADAAAAYAADAAAYAASAAAYAASAADAAAAAADAADARLQTRRAQADIIRRHFPTLPMLASVGGAQ